MIVAAIILSLVGCENVKEYHESSAERELAAAAADSIAGRMDGWNVVSKNLWECDYSRQDAADGQLSVYYRWVATYHLTDGHDTLIVTADSHQFDVSGVKHEYYYKGRVTGQLIGHNDDVDAIKRQNLAMRRACEGKDGFSLDESGAHVLSADVEIYGPVVSELPRSAYGLE